MRVKSQELKRAVGICLIPRGEGEALKLKVCAARVTFQAYSASILPYPVAPRELLTDARGKVVKDSDGKAMTFDNEQDPKFREDTTRRSLRLTAWMVYEALAEDESVEFENKEPAKLTQESAAQWLDSLALEIEKAGFSFGDMNLIVDTSINLSNSNMKIVEGYRDSFLLREANRLRVTKSPSEAMPEPSAI